MSICGGVIMKVMSVSDFKEYKKKSVDLVLEMENLKNSIKELLEMKRKFENSQIYMSREQEDDLDIIEERISRCIDYFNEF